MFKFKCQAMDVIPGEENIFDKLVYMFTSDKSVSEKIGNMIYQMGKLDSDQRKAFESLPLNKIVQKYEVLKRLMSYSARAVDFVETNIKKYENMSYNLLDSDRKKIQDEIGSEVDSFEQENNAQGIKKLMSDEPDVKKETTYAEAGYTYDNFMALAKEFKDAQTGKLAKLRKMRIISYCTATEIKDWKIRVVHNATYRFNDLLGVGIEVYKYCDSFLFYTYRKLVKEGLITE